MQSTRCLSDHPLVGFTIAPNPAPWRRASGSKSAYPNVAVYLDEQSVFRAGGFNRAPFAAAPNSPLVPGYVIYQEDWNNAQINVGAVGVINYGVILNGGNYRVRGADGYAQQRS